MHSATPASGSTVRRGWYEPSQPGTPAACSPTSRLSRACRRRTECHEGASPVAASGLPPRESTLLDKCEGGVFDEPDVRLLELAELAGDRHPQLIGVVVELVEASLFLRPIRRTSRSTPTRTSSSLLSAKST